MSKKRYRFFGGLLAAQENWLNEMAGKGFRLVRAEKLLYEFEECEPGRVQYRVEFIGHKSKAAAGDYRDFLEDLGYKVFFKSINLNYAVGKVRWRPWAEKGGRVATNATTFNRELLIVEKESDGKPFALHTSHEDVASYYRSLRGPYLTLAILFGVMGIATQSLVFGMIGLASLVPVIIYQLQIVKSEREAKTAEW